MAEQPRTLTFDLGDTLVEYEGFPLSWEPHYPEALTRLAKFANTQPTPDNIAAAQCVLRKYNCRITPRDIEVSFAKILGELLECFGVVQTQDELPCAEAYFSLFRQKLRCFPDVVPVLQSARARRQKIGVFTDVPYGMPRELVMEDVSRSGLTDLIDVLITSRDAGFRKPRPQTLHALSIALDCAPNQMIYIGNERKDIDAALAFGCEAVLLDRNGSRPDWGQHKTITSLNEL